MVSTLLVAFLESCSGLVWNPSIFLSLEAPVVAIKVAGNSSGSYINGANKTFFPLAGTCSENDQKIVVSGDVAASTSCVGGKWALNLDFSSVPDGVVAISVDHINAKGISATTVTRSFIKDTNVPTISIYPLSDNISISNVQSYSIGGTCVGMENGQIVTLNVGSATIAATSCFHETWRLDANLKSIADASPLTVVANGSDIAGNSALPASARVNKDTLAPVITLSNSIGLFQGGQPVTLNWTLTETNVLASQNFSVSYSIDDGATWNAFGTVAASDGPLVNQAFSYTGNIPNLTSSHFKLSVAYTDLFGNSVTAASPSLQIDGLAPTLTSVSLPGSTTVTSPLFSVLVNATDSDSGVAAVRLAEAVSGNCQTAYANSGWQPFSNRGGVQRFSYTSSFSSGTRKLCAWAKDKAGNVSQITGNSGSGTASVDTTNYTLVLASPPVFSSLSVTNGEIASPNFGSGTVALGEKLNVSFTVEAAQGLANHPVGIYYSTDGVNYASMLADASTVGATSGNPTSWTKTIATIAAPTSGFFRLKFMAQDTNGIISSTLAPPLNTGFWSVFAGTDSVGDGASALSARISLNSNRNTAITSDGAIYFFDNTTSCLRKIDPSTGIVNSFLCSGADTAVGIPSSGTANINSAVRLPSSLGGQKMSVLADGMNLYIVMPTSRNFSTTSGAIFRINTSANTIETYAGGGSLGTSVVGAVSDATRTYIDSNMTNAAIDPISKDIYFSQPCSGTAIDVSYSEQVIVVRVRQDATSKNASIVEKYAGSCSFGRGTYANGSDALNVPLAQGNGSSTGSFYIACCSYLHFDSITSTLYGSIDSSSAYKIVAGKIYALPGIPSISQSVSSPTDGRVYVPYGNGGIAYFTPSATASTSETITPYIAPYSSASNSTCADDGVDVASACAYASVVMLTSDGKLAFNNGNNGNSSGITWIRIVDNVGKLRTIAGTRYLSGIGNDIKTASFNAIQTLLYTSHSTGGSTNLTPGLYIADSGAFSFARANPTSGLLEIVGGNQIAKNPINGGSFGSVPISSAAGTFGVGDVTFDQNGLLVWQSGKSITRLLVDNTMSSFMAGNKDPSQADDGDSLSTLGLWDSGGGTGMVSDSSGRLYYGGYRVLTGNYQSYPRIGMLDPSIGKYYRVIGADAPPIRPTTDSSGDAASADGPVYSASKYKSLQCQPYAPNSSSPWKGEGSCYIQFDQRYNANEGRLLFAEQNKIRAVTRPWDNSTSTLSTLWDMTRPVGAYVIQYVDLSSATIDRVYYVSGGKLYCYRVTGGDTAGCSNASLGPPSGMPSLNATTLAMDDSGNLYAVSSNKRVVYKLAPPN